MTREGGEEEGRSDIVPRLHPNYLILPETARNPGYSATVRFQRPNSSSLSRQGEKKRGEENAIPSLIRRQGGKDGV